jgi:hypothetical protein
MADSTADFTADSRPGRRAGRSRARDALLVLPAIPAAALLLTPWLPFVDSAKLWFGLPSMLVWPAVWVFLVVPALAAVEWGRTRYLDAERAEPDARPDETGRPDGGAASGGAASGEEAGA